MLKLLLVSSIALIAFNSVDADYQNAGDFESFTSAMKKDQRAVLIIVEDNCQCCTDVQPVVLKDCQLNKATCYLHNVGSTSVTYKYGPINIVYYPMIAFYKNGEQVAIMNKDSKLCPSGEEIDEYFTKIR